MRTGWSRFLDQGQKDLRLWLALVALLQLARVLLLAVCHGHLASGSDAGTVLAGLRSGLRFDIQLATLLVLPTLLLSALGSAWAVDAFNERLRRWWSVALVVATVVVTGIDLGYIGEYGNQFDQFLFGVIFDDFGAILITIWRTYPVVWGVLGMGLFIAAACWLLLRWLRAPFLVVDPALPAPAAWLRVVVGVLALVVVTFGVRGSWQRLPLQQKAAALSPDPFINALTPTPFHALRFAIGDYLTLQRSTGVSAFLPDGDLVGAGEALFPGRVGGRDIDRWMERTAPGTVSRPDHVFLLIMESYDGWPFAEAYRPLGLTTQVASLGKDGLLVTSFVAASVGTMASLSAILTGFPDVGVHTPYQPSARAPFPSSPAAIFKRLGYRTRFFYSGYLSWERIGDFCTSQGFDEVHGGGSIDGGKSGNEWGADDEHLLGYVQANLPTDQPSFNVILSTSNHPPFDVDVYGHGFPLRAIPPELAARYDGHISLETLGHLWYSDQAAARFIRAMDQRAPRSLFALTGDHWSRRFLDRTPTFPERSLVPLLLYGPQVLKDVPLPAHPTGGHLDIAPTLIELCAPAGFTYHGLGENLLRPRRGLGVGVNCIVGPDFIAEMGSQAIIHPLPDHAPPAQPPDGRQLQRLHQAWNGIGWWRVMRGNRADDPGAVR